MKFRLPNPNIVVNQNYSNIRALAPTNHIRDCLFLSESSPVPYKKACMPLSGVIAILLAVFKCSVLVFESGVFLHQFQNPKKSCSEAKREEDSRKLAGGY